MPRLPQMGFWESVAIVVVFSVVVVVIDEFLHRRRARRHGQPGAARTGH